MLSAKKHTYLWGIRCRGCPFARSRNAVFPFPPKKKKESCPVCQPFSATKVTTGVRMPGPHPRHPTKNNRFLPPKAGPSYGFSPGKVRPPEATFCSVKGPPAGAGPRLTADAITSFTNPQKPSR